jgi:antitoxin component YwqK of YwqJK toxin-antitoxin module
LKRTTYYKNGERKEEANYKSDGGEIDEGAAQASLHIQHGKSYSWWEDGKRQRENNYKDGEKDGKNTFFDNHYDGFIEEIYENGIEISYKQHSFYNNGKKHFHKYRTPTEKGHTNWMKNGSLRFVETQKPGDWFKRKDYYENGNINKFEQRKEGEWSRVSLYYKNGKLKSEKNFDKNHRAHGKFTYWQKQGKVDGVVTYIHGRRQYN